MSEKELLEKIMKIIKDENTSAIATVVSIENLIHDYAREMPVSRTEIPKDFDVMVYCPDCKKPLAQNPLYGLYCWNCNKWHPFGIKKDEPREEDNEEIYYPGRRSFGQSGRMVKIRKTKDEPRRERSEHICKYCSNYIDQIMINEECCQVDGCPKFKDHNEAREAEDNNV